MAFDTRVEGVTEETQHVIDEFLSHLKIANTYGGLIRRIPKELGVTDFREFTYEQYQLLMNQYKGSKTNSHCIDSLFKYLYLLGWLKEHQQFGLLYGDKEKIRKHFADMESKKVEKTNVSKKVEPALSFLEIEKLIEYCKEVAPVANFSGYKNMRMAFAFYALFFVGISREGLMKMSMGSYLDGTILVDNEYIVVPEKYRSMFEFAKREGRNGKYIDLNKYIKNLGKAVGIEELMPKDIITARKNYLFNCPACGEAYLSFGKNWKIVNGKIVCSECAAQLVEKDVKKNIVSEWNDVEISLISEDEKEKIACFVSDYEQLRENLTHPCDFASWNHFLKQIGDLGEKYVYEKEIQKLLDANREDLAEKVDIEIAKDNTNGYDILSYTTTEQELHIEVKTTPGSVDTPFYISQNEWDKAKQFITNGELYEIHRVYNAGRDDISVQIYRDLGILKREEIAYKVTVNEFNDR